MMNVGSFAFALLKKNQQKEIVIKIDSYVMFTKKNLNLQLGKPISYLSSFLKANYIISETTNLTMGLRKTLWDKKGVITLTAEDILGLANSRLTSKYLNQDYSYFAKPETQFIRVGFTYNFGNFKLKDNKRSIEKVERDRLKKD